MKNVFLTLFLLYTLIPVSHAQITERERPAEWSNLIEGSRFLDRILPIPVIGKKTSNTWGVNGVLPRYVDNGIEDAEWSYWGGNILKGDDGQFHLFVCRWREDSKKGHMEWPRSTVVHAISDNSFGPFKVLQSIGKGHNPEAYRLENGAYIVSVIDGYYYATDINGPWESRRFDFNARDRQIPDGLSNLTFTQREDGSYLMMCRGGSIWCSKDGESSFNLLTSKSVYPPYEGNYEDPVIWRTNIQYHMIVHDWKGRIAYYMRSADGIEWKLDPGEAYVPGMAKYEDGSFVDWFKFERIKIFQDEFGRATQANFAVIDTLKHNDLGNDTHSSKNIGVPLQKGRLLSILNEDKLSQNTKNIRVKVNAEKGFNPHKDIDLKSLRFGATEEVNFGRGSKLIDTAKDGKNLILIFDGKGNGISEKNFAAKLLGKTSDGELLFGYARLPQYDYLKPFLSPRQPLIQMANNKGSLHLEVQNFGQTISKESTLKIEYRFRSKWRVLTSGIISPLKPYEKKTLQMQISAPIVNNEELATRVTINHPEQAPITLEGLQAIRNPRAED